MMELIERSYKTDLPVLVDHIDPACLVTPIGLGEVCVHRSTDDHVIQTVSVHITNSHSMPKVGANLEKYYLVAIPLFTMKVTWLPVRLCSCPMLRPVRKITFPVRFAPRGIPMAMSEKESESKEPSAREYPKSVLSSDSGPSSVEKRSSLLSRFMLYPWPCQ